MKKKENYESAVVDVIDMELEQPILAGSGIGLNGLPDHFYFDPTPGNGGDAY